MSQEQPIKRGLTERQREYLVWITNYIQEHDFQSPSMEEIGRAMGTSTAAAQRIVQEIVNRGHLVTLKGAQRSLAIPQS